MVNRLDADETVIYKLQKSKMPIVFLLLFAPIWLYFSGIFFTPFYRYLFLGAKGINPKDAYLAGIIGFLVFIPFILLILISYTGNNLIITNKRVFVRKGIMARTQMAYHEDIRSFQHAYSTGRRGSSNNRIYFYLYCGKLIKTGDLFITYASMQTLLELLREKFEGRGFSILELKRLGEQNPEARRPITKKHPIVLIILLAPILLGLLVFAGYILAP